MTSPSQADESGSPASTHVGTRVPRYSLWTRALVMLGITVALANMAAAWVVLYRQPEVRPQRSTEDRLMEIRRVMEIVDPESATSVTAVQPPADPTAAIASNDFTNKFMRYALAGDIASDGGSTSPGTIASIALGFALIAIGFSLFVMGIEGALSVNAKAERIGSLILTTASPGLACIVVAAALVATALLAQRANSFDPEIEAKAELVRAQAQARETEATANAELIRANAEAVQMKAQAEAELLRERAMYGGAIGRK